MQQTELVSHIRVQWFEVVRRLLAAKSVHGWLITMAAMSATLTIALDLPHRDLSVPFGFEGDTLYTMSAVEAVIETGWYWRSPTLSAPYTLDLRAFPCNNSVDHGLVWVISRFTTSPGLALNTAWLLTFFLGGTVAFFGFNYLGVHHRACIICALLYALLPFAFFRATHHFSLTFYLVPAICVLAVLLACSECALCEGRASKWLLLACALVGWNYIYNAAFAIFVLCCGTVIGYVESRDKRVMRNGLRAIVVVGICSVLNVAPTLYAWQKDGKPYVDYKSPADAEVYGLKLRQLMSPVPTHSLAPLKTWLTKEQQAQFPLENENSSSRLGIIPACGFIVLLGLLFVPMSAARGELGRRTYAAAQLNLAAVLLATVGGFGALVNLLVLPDVRCYNRIVVYIAFFAVFAVGTVLSRVASRLEASAPVLIIVLIGVLVVIGCYDQTRAATGLRVRNAQDEQLAASVTSVVRQAEATLPSGAMIYQLPVTPFPVDAGAHRMGPYEHARPHFYSKRLRWSWPNFSLKHQEWQASADALSPVALVQYLSESGFAAIWLDQYGYADSRSSPQGVLRAVLGDPILRSNDERYLVFDLRRAGKIPRVEHLGEKYNAAYSWGHGVRFDGSVRSEPPVVWLSGWCPPEPPGFRWTIGKSASMEFYINPVDTEEKLTIKVRRILPYKRFPVIVSIDGTKVGEWNAVGDELFSMRLPAAVLAQKNRFVLRFEMPEATTPRALGVNDDPRVLGLAVSELWLGK